MASSRHTVDSIVNEIHATSILGDHQRIYRKRIQYACPSDCIYPNAQFSYLYLFLVRQDSQEYCELGKLRVAFGVTLLLQEG